MGYRKNLDNQTTSSTETIYKFDQYVRANSQCFSQTEMNYLNNQCFQRPIDTSTFINCNILDAINCLPEKHDIYARIFAKLAKYIRNKRVVISSRELYPSLGIEAEYIKRHECSDSVIEYSPRLITNLDCSISAKKENLNYQDLRDTDFLIIFGLFDKLRKELPALEELNNSICLIMPDINQNSNQAPKELEILRGYTTTETAVHNNGSVIKMLVRDNILPF